MRTIRQHSKQRICGVALSMAVIGSLVLGLVPVQAESDYQFSTIYHPNKHANASLQVCRQMTSQSEQLVVRYTGNDSPLMRLSFQLLLKSSPENRLGCNSQS